MSIVNLKLPEGVHCESHVFRTDEYEEIVHLFPEFIRDLARNLPIELQRAPPKRKASYLAGRLCSLRALLISGCSTVQLPSLLNRTKEGLPIWPLGFTGSITHIQNDRMGLVISLVAKTYDFQSIGVDCEIIFSIEQALDVAGMIASENELQLGKRMAISFEVWLTIIYSLKETLFKLLFFKVNRFMPFEAAEVLSFDLETGQACLILKVDWGNVGEGRRIWLNATLAEVENFGKLVLVLGDFVENE